MDITPLGIFIFLSFLVCLGLYFLSFLLRYGNKKNGFSPPNPMDFPTRKKVYTQYHENFPLLAVCFFLFQGLLAITIPCALIFGQNSGPVYSMVGTLIYILSMVVTYLFVLFSKGFQWE